MPKNQFIKKLMEFSREDIRKFIEEKGKEPKLVPLMTPISK